MYGALKLNKMRSLVIADIHGGYKALEQVLQRASVTREDKLIFLGDFVDGYSQSYEVIEKLLKLNNTNECVFILGNHDEWLLQHINNYGHGSNWHQGAEATRQSYIDHIGDLNLPESHKIFFSNLRKYYKDEDNNIFVHGGFNRHFELKDQQIPYIFYWDRDLWSQALSAKNLKDIEDDMLPLNRKVIKFNIKEPCKDIFIGHTTTLMWKTDKPMNACNIWNLDTGCGYNGKLTIMDVDTKEYWQSDNLRELYPNERGR
jgi:serine/threonine protein phosphatase 1